MCQGIHHLFYVSHNCYLVSLRYYEYLLSLRIILLLRIFNAFYKLNYLYIAINTFVCI